MVGYAATTLHCIYVRAQKKASEIMITSPNPTILQPANLLIHHRTIPQIRFEHLGYSFRTFSRL